MKEWNQRKTFAVLFVFSVLVLSAVTVAGAMLSEQAVATDFSVKFRQPCVAYPLGTDGMGRDMLARTLAGLSFSVRIGILTAAVSTLIAFVLGSLSAAGGTKVDAFILWLIDLVMGVPHLLLVLLISFAVGGGTSGVFIGITLTHWMHLARVIRAEVLQLKTCGYVKAAEKLGVSKRQIVRRHMVPHLFSQLMVGFVLLFPDAVLHETSITFLGFGLTPEQPAMGIILSESMKYLSVGKWWLAFFPGLFLVITVLLFYMAGSILKELLVPESAHR